MPEVHLVTGVAVLSLNLAAGAVGGVAWLRDRPSVPFWYLLRAAQIAVFVQVGLGALLLLSGYEQPDDLHYLYGLLPVPVALLAEGARAGAAQRELGDTDYEDLSQAQQHALALAIVRREMGIMATSCGVITFLALRAAGTGGLL